MIHRRLLALLVLASCSSSDGVKIDYTVTFTDGAGKNLGVKASGSLSSLTATEPTKTLDPSTATLDVKSDMTGLHFTFLEDGMRRGQLTCTSQPGSGSASASAEVSTGGHYLLVVNYKGARCIPEQ